MKKRKTYIKPAVALVACAALVVGVAYGDVPGKIMNNNTVSTNSGTSAPGEKESVVNSFAVKVKAAEVQKLEKEKRYLSFLRKTVTERSGAVTRKQKK